MIFLLYCQKYNIIYKPDAFLKTSNMIDAFLINTYLYITESVYITVICVD